ncbi:MAG TPA: hypothetical protein VLJ10_03240, partial [Candidatus Bathyarchaeia archaeon]|nr:hypothetical protein [Candidatus Bathyarchaeia archaeon]
MVQKKNPKGADVFDVLPKGASKGGDSAMLGGMRPWLTRSTACLGFGVFSLLVSPASPQSGFAQSIDQPVSAVVESQEKDSPEKLVLDIRGFTSEERAHFNLVLQIIRNFDPESLKILTDLNQSGRLSIAIASEESMKQLVMVAKSMDPLAKQEAAIHIGGVTIYEWQKAVNGKPSYAVFINERANAVEFLMFTLHELAGHVAQDERYAYGWTLSYQEKEEKAHSVEKSMLETLVDNREKIVEGAATAGMPFSDIYWLEDALHTARMNRRVSDIQVTLDRWSRVNDQSDGTGQAQLPERNQEILGLQESYDFIDFHALTKIENPALAAEIARELKRGLDMVERISTFFLRSGLSDKRLFVAFDKDTQEITIEFPEGGSDRHVIPAAQLPDLWKYMIHDNIYFGGLPDQVKELFMEIDHAPRNEAIRGKIKRRIEALKSQNWKELRDGAPSESTELGIEASFVADRHFEQYRDEYLGLVPEETLTEPMRMFMDALINSGTVTASVIPARHSWKGPAIMIAVMGAGAVGFGLWRHVRNKEQNDSDENSDSAMLADLREKILDVSDAGQLDRVTAAKKYLADPSSRTNKSGNSDMLFDLWDQTAYEDENHVLHQL